MLQLRDKLSLFLAFRRWDIPTKKKTYTYYDDTAGLLRYLYDLKDLCEHKKVGICLSAGIDSGLVSAILRPSVAYTLVYRGNDGEFTGAAPHLCGAKHIPLLVTKPMYFDAAREVIDLLQEPITPHSPFFYMMAKRAQKDGCEILLTGLGAEGNGEMSHLYAHTGRAGFIRALLRMTVDPTSVLKDPADIDWVFDMYCENGRIDVQRFLSEIGTGGAGSANEGAIDLVGIQSLSPFKDVRFSGRFSPSKIARGEIKPYLAAAYHKVYGTKPPKKKALAAPYKQWMSGWRHSRPEFLPNFRGRVALPGKRLFLAWALERYLNNVGGHNAT